MKEELQEIIEATDDLRDAVEELREAIEDNGEQRPVSDLEEMQVAIRAAEDTVRKYL